MKNIFDGFLGGIALGAMIMIFVKSIVVCWPWYIVLFVVGLIIVIEDYFIAEEDNDDDHYGF